MVQISGLLFSASQVCTFKLYMGYLILKAKLAHYSYIVLKSKRLDKTVQGIFMYSCFWREWEREGVNAIYKKAVVGGYAKLIPFFYHIKD